MSLYLIICLICSLYSYGTVLAFWTREYPNLNVNSEDRSLNTSIAITSGLISLLCPIFVVVVFLVTAYNKHGWRLLNLK